MSKLSPCQEAALVQLESGKNIFLTGVAGSGKSFLIDYFLGDKDPRKYPILASTGAAAILVGGRTLHSFFGLGILEGGIEKTVQKALKDKRVIRRVQKAHYVIIDEVSMISGQTLHTAERIASLARGSDESWGGLQVIVVGDFAQLPPVNRYAKQKEWCFLDPVWERSEFEPAILRTIMRTEDESFLEVLNFVRNGELNQKVRDFLNRRKLEAEFEFQGTRLFSRRDATERFNLQKLHEIDAELVQFETKYRGEERFIEALKKQAPVPEVLQIKEGALVMIRQNDPKGKWVNGSLGTLINIEKDLLEIELLDCSVIELDKTTFTILDAEGEPVASAENFPITLAYASTIHKAQGSTIDRMLVDLRNLWEPGQAYVALSRVKSAKGLWLQGWTPNSFRTDPNVTDFHHRIGF